MALKEVSLSVTSAASLAGASAATLDTDTDGSSEVTVPEQPEHGPLPWRTICRQAVVCWVGTRLALALFTYLLQVFILNLTGSPITVSRSVGTYLGMWDRWDAVYYYLPIAQHGYALPADYNFFPLFPVTVGTLMRLVGDSAGVGTALVVSNLGALAALIAVGGLAVWEFGAFSAANRTMRLVLVYPFAFFLAAPYPTSWLLAFAAGAILAARRGQWALCAALAALAMLTHPTVIALFPMLVWEFGTQHAWSLRSLRALTAPRDALLAVGSIPAALASYALFCLVRTGNGLAFIASQQVTFSHHLLWPWQTLGVLIGNFRTAGWGTYAQARLLLDVIPLAIAIGYLIWAWRGRRIPSSYWLLVASLVALCVAMPVVNYPFPDAVLSSGRYLILALPIYFSLVRGVARRPDLETCLLYSCLVLQVALLAFYLLDGWLV